MTASTNPDNFERWKNYTKYLPTTETYVEFGWLFIVSSALQRRVWFGDENGQPLYPNLYGCFVGSAAVGKGVILGEVNRFLTHHKRIKGYEGREEQASDVEKIKKRSSLYNVGPQDVTYQAYTQALSEGTDHFRHEVQGKKRLYAHTSMVFILEELETLFKKGDNDERLHKMLLTAFDCKDFQYKTKHQGDFEIHNPCVGILAGVTPDSLGKLFAKGILNDGFVSRTLLLFENEGRDRSFFLRQPDDSMYKDREILLEQVLKLSKVFGPLTVPNDVVSFLEHWHETEHKKAIKLSSQRMLTYMNRKQVQILKLAAAYHFSDSTSLTLTLPSFQKALAFLAKIEPKLSFGLSSTGRNELERSAKEVLRYIESRPTGSIVELFIEFKAELTLAELTVILEQLEFLGKISREGNNYQLK